MNPTIPKFNDLIFLPAGLYFIGLAIYVAAIVKARGDGALLKPRWLGAAFIVAGLIASWGPAWDAMNPGTGGIYRLMLTRKMLAAHVLPPLAALLLLGGMIGLDLHTKKYIRDHFGA